MSGLEELLKCGSCAYELHGPEVKEMRDGLMCLNAKAPDCRGPMIRSWRDEPTEEQSTIEQLMQTQSSLRDEIERLRTALSRETTHSVPLCPCGHSSDEHKQVLLCQRCVHDARP